MNLKRARRQRFYFFNFSFLTTACVFEKTRFVTQISKRLDMKWHGDAFAGRVLGYRRARDKSEKAKTTKGN